jgi:hypothetical protein
VELKLKHQYLADENEREDAAKYYLDEFSEGTIKDVRFIAGPYRSPDLTKDIVAYLEYKLDDPKIEVIEEKVPIEVKQSWFSKLLSAIGLSKDKKIEQEYSAYPQYTLNCDLFGYDITYEKMLLLGCITYDVILGFNTSAGAELHPNSQQRISTEGNG